MSQLPLFAPLFYCDDDDDGDELRYYQREALGAIEAKHRDNRGVLLLMATGLGKTHVFCNYAKQFDGAVLVLAHREELVNQAARRLEAVTGEPVEIEQGVLHASHSARLVVGSVDSVKQQRRLERMGRDRFQLIIMDEVHHYVAKTYRRPLDWWPDAKRLGVTATADRGDGKALGKILNDTAYVFDIIQGVQAGYLVPLKGCEVFLEEVDLSHIKKTKGDLEMHKLDEEMIKAVEGICRKTLDLAPERQGIAFFPGVRSAEYAAHRFNELIPGSACFISGKTPRDQRRQFVDDFKQGKYKYLCNCQIATEGFDAPSASLIIQGRPTLSRAFYAQTAGRGTRVLPGCVDHVTGSSGAEERRRLIAASDKPDTLILDFVGNAGRHSLVTAADLLGGSYSDDEVKEAKKKLAEKPDDVDKALQQARAELRALAQATKARVQARAREFDPFRILNMKMPDKAPYHEYGKTEPLTEKQRELLVNKGVPEAKLRAMSKSDAGRLITNLLIRQKHQLASYRQLYTLKQWGIGKTNISFNRASRAIDYFKSLKRGQAVDANRVDNILAGKW